MQALPRCGACEEPQPGGADEWNQPVGRHPAYPGTGEAAGRAAARPFHAAAGPDRRAESCTPICAATCCAARKISRRRWTRSRTRRRARSGSLRFIRSGFPKWAGCGRNLRASVPAPQLQVELLRPDKVYEAVLEDQADLGFISYPEHRRELTVIPWREERMTVAAYPSHPFAARGHGAAARSGRAGLSSPSTRR